MCNPRPSLRIPSPLASPEGSATQALERSLKRPRTSLTDSPATSLNAAFNLDRLFDSIQVESFPSIQFPGDDEDDEKDSSMVYGLLRTSRKRSRTDNCNSLSRSKSFKNGLDSLVHGIAACGPEMEMPTDKKKSLSVSKTSHGRLGKLALLPLELHLRDDVRVRAVF